MADDSYNRTNRTNERPARDPPAPEPNPDPLVELARLIGQNDSFAYDAGGSARREPRMSDVPVARDQPPAPRTPDLPPIPRWPVPGRSDAPSAPRYDDRFAPHGAADQPRVGWPPQSDDRRRPSGFDEPLQRVEEPLPRSYSEPMYPRAAEPRGYDPRFAPDEPAYPAQDDAYPGSEHSDTGHGHADAPADPAYAQHDRRSDDYRDYEPGQDGAYETGEYVGEERGRYDDDDSDYDERRPERPRSLLMVAAVFALAVLGTAGALGYRSMGGKTAPTEPPVIKADNTPNKVASASQAGDANKQIYERLGGQGERMVAREEQPVDIRDAGARGLVPGVAPAFPDGPVAAPVAVPLTSATAPRGPAPAAAGQPGEPKKIRTVTIRPDQQGVAAPTQRTPTRPANAPLSLNPQGRAPAETVPAAPPARGSQTALASPPPPRAGESGNYVVQLSAQKSESEAQASFRAMQAKYPNVLTGHRPLIRKKDLGAKGIYYGAQVGPFASREEAAQLCESLKSAGGTCIVQKN